MYPFPVKNRPTHKMPKKIRKNSRWKMLKVDLFIKIVFLQFLLESLKNCSFHQGLFSEEALT